MIGDEQIAQDVPIISQEEVEKLLRMEFVVKRGKAPYIQQIKTDMYHATDTEFMTYLARVTKTKKKILLEGLSVKSEEGWNNKNRLQTRLLLFKRHQKALFNSLTKS